MRVRLSILAALCAAFLVGAPAAHTNNGHLYYVALGDSVRRSRTAIPSCSPRR